VSVAVGDQLLIVDWTPNADADTVGYNIFIDPIPGQEQADGSLPPPTPVQVCPDSGASPSSVDGAVTDGATNDANAGVTLDASTGTDAGCHYSYRGGSSDGGGGGTCSDPILAGGVTVAAGDAAMPIAGDSGDDGSATIPATGSGGISTIPQQYQLGSTPTVSGVSSNSYTVSGLKDGTTYTVVVAAVDGTGNIGPPSQEACDYPAPVNDFWNRYREAGGAAGGGFCALEAVGAPTPSLAVGGAFLISAVAIARRRLRRPDRERVFAPSDG
jgi:hypothetical protein